MDDQNQTNPTPDPMTPVTPEQPGDVNQPQDGGSEMPTPPPADPFAPTSEMPAGETPAQPTDAPLGGDTSGDTNQGPVV